MTIIINHVSAIRAAALLCRTWRERPVADLEAALAAGRARMVYDHAAARVFRSVPSSNSMRGATIIGVGDTAKVQIKAQR